MVILFGLLVLLFFCQRAPGIGTRDWRQAWLFILFLMIYFILYIIFRFHRDPDQTKERSKTGSNVKRWDKVIMSTYTVLLPTVLILTGLDVGRFDVSTVPLSIQILSWFGLVFAGMIIMWTVITNTYLSRYARIQDDREQQVIITGPYQYVRHSMYLGIIILFLCFGPALGSLLALIPGCLIWVLLIIRTAKEDKCCLKNCLVIKNIKTGCAIACCQEFGKF